MEESKLEAHVRAAEYTIAKVAIANGDPVTALKNSQKRHDRLISEVLAGSPVGIDCGAGCWYCCHLMVLVTACEALAIAEHVKGRLSKMQVAGVLKMAEENAAILRPLSDDERLTTNLKCPFLVEGRCIVYPVRPESCRLYHSTDVRWCEKSCSNPQDMDIPNVGLKDYDDAAKGHFLGFSRAMAEAGYDADVYELSVAFLEAMAGPSPLKRFMKLRRTFLNGG